MQASKVCLLAFWVCLLALWVYLLAFKACLLALWVCLLAFKACLLSLWVCLLASKVCLLAPSFCRLPDKVCLAFSTLVTCRIGHKSEVEPNKRTFCEYCSYVPYKTHHGRCLDFLQRVASSFWKTRRPGGYSLMFMFF
jgi:hypothetical protein